MKKGSFYLVMAIIWGMGMLAWIGCLVKDAQGGIVNPFQVVAAVCSVICFVLNLLTYFRLRKQEK